MAQDKITRLHLISILFFTLITLLAVQVMSYDDARTVRSFEVPPIPEVLQSQNIQTYVGLRTTFTFLSDMESIGDLRFCWDFNEDGIIDWSSSKQAESHFTYSKPGTYTATLSISGTDYPTPVIQITVKVDDGFGQQSILPNDWYTSRIQRAQGTDKITKTKYALIVCNSAENRFYINNVKPWYYFLRDSVGISDSNIYLICPPDSSDTAFLPYIDYIWYSKTRLDSAFYDISQRMTPQNDEFYLIITGHGSGLLWDYSVPYPTYINYDTTENIQELYEDSLHYYYNTEYYYKSLWYSFRKPHPYDSLGLYCYDRNLINDPYRDDPIDINRNILKSHFTNMPYYDSLGNVQLMSDSDVFLEKFHYYPLGDTNRNGIVERAEVWDWDNDGNPPAWIDSATQTVYYDEDDWDTIAGLVYDDYNVSSASTYILLDEGLNDTVDVDIYPFAEIDLVNYPSNPDVDGTDSDGDGRIYSIDFNDDGDKTDSLALDESILGGVYDDWIADWIDSLAPSHTVVLMENCFSGGFIDDLSRSGLIIGTASDGRSYAFGEYFLEYMCSVYVDISLFEAADVDSNDCVSIMEAYNAIPYGNDEFRFDDNGDFYGYVAPLPNNGDGYYAEILSFAEQCLQSDTTGYVYGDADSSGTCNVGDAIYINNHIFNGGSAPRPLNAGDPNGSCAINIGDVVFLIKYVFSGGDAPVAGCVE